MEAERVMIDTDNRGREVEIEFEHKNKICDIITDTSEKATDRDGESKCVEVTIECNYSQGGCLEGILDYNNNNNKINKSVEGIVEGESIGRFLYLEGEEYLMYNTYDVHFYASWALVSLFPLIDNEIQKDFAQAILSEDDELRVCLYEKKKAKRHEMGCVPHDLGGPGEAPLVRVNIYNLHHTQDWKDLPSKFVLQVWRNYYLTKDINMLKQCWNAVRVVMIRVMRFVDNKTGLVVHGGWPDHTYDCWSCNGVSAYSGGLWVAALKAYTAIAETLECIEQMSPDYSSVLVLTQLAESNWDELLWNDSGYYMYSSKGSQSVHSDQLAGIMFCNMVGLSVNIPKERILKALKTIYDVNVMKFKEGRWGAVNGMRSNLNDVDNDNLQSREVWVGVVYSLAATYIQYGLMDKGFKVAEGIFNSCWDELGYWFQTPEAYTGEGKYRSLCYMRPLSIWAIQLLIQAGMIEHTHSHTQAHTHTHTHANTDTDTLALCTHTPTDTPM
eukprot:GHVR01061440.1.p1 GENE.GHVR01061440.1~~GHVR01061440.1.p1  ORF type:complete len:499 (+),score=138.94 GHVR01061440.1:219-1715(+)